MTESYSDGSNEASANALAESGEPRSLMFVHSAVDELRLSLPQFRLYAHIHRRGKLFARPKETAELCCFDEDTYWRAAADLEAFGLIRRERRPGTTSQFTITPQCEWNWDAIKNRPRRRQPKQPTGKNGAPEMAGHPANSVDDTGNSRARVGGINGVRPTGFNGAQSTSPQGGPKKGIKESHPDGFSLDVLLDGVQKPIEWKDAFRNWIDYRNNHSKAKKLQPVSIKAQLTKVLRWPDADLIEGVQDSIANGYQGLFQPKRSSPGGQNLQTSKADHGKGFFHGT